MNTYQLNKFYVFRFFLTTLFLSLVLNLNAQPDSLKISGVYNMSLTNFFSTLESNYPVSFFFNPNDLKNQSVEYNASNEDLNSVLLTILKESGLNFYIDNYNQIIVYKGKQIVDHLPDYTSSNKSNKKNSQENTNNLTSAEKKYIEGRKVTDLELITVGEKGNNGSNSTHYVRGKMIDDISGEPLIGATVYIEELKLGAASDLDGFFSIALKPGKYKIIANCMAMKERTFFLQVYNDGTITIPMEKDVVSINEVTIVADRHDNVKGMQMGYEKLTTKSMKEIPAVMGEKDLLKVAQMLPGVQSAGEGASGLNVRGGTADQNLFYINKMPIYNTSHLFGFFTAFSPDIVTEFALYKSNIPAKYGGRVASIFDITTRQGNKKEFFGKGGINPITGHIAVEGPIVKDKTSFVLSYRGSYSDWLLKRMNDEDLKNSNASFYDISLGINSEINKKNVVRFFAYNSNDDFSLASTNDYDYHNTGGSFNLKHFFSPKLNADFTAVYSEYGFGHNNKENLSEAYRQKYGLKHIEFKSDLVYLTSSNHRILFGASGIFYDLDRGKITPYNDESTRITENLGAEKGIETAFYASDEYQILPRLSVLAGLRFTMYGKLGPEKVYEYFANSSIDENNIKDSISFSKNQLVKSYSGFEPRIAFNYSLANNISLKASYNRLQQYIFMLSNTIAMAPTDQWKLADYNLKPPIFHQISLGYYHNFPKKAIESSLEVYKKWGKNVVEYRDGASFISSDPVEWELLQGNQDSYGIEFMLKKNAGQLKGWVSYCYSRSFITINSSIETEQINDGSPYPSNYDRPHSFNFVGTYRTNRRLSFSTNVVYSTGRPITYPIATYEDNTGQEYLVYSDRNKYRIPDYFRVDFSINLEGNLKRQKWLHSYWMLNVYNLTGRKNAYSIYFESDEGSIQGYKLSIFGQPIVTLSWNFKFGNYTSE